jgi:hypothetical protein
MTKKKSSDNERRYLAMWDCYGLECLFDITDSDHDAMIAGLKGETFKIPYNISMMIMRAKYNTQRSYEIYAFTTEPDVDYDTILEMFKHSPQVIVDAIRRNGHKIHSDYNPSPKVIA